MLQYSIDLSPITIVSQKSNPPPPSPNFGPIFCRGENEHHPKVSLVLLMKHTREVWEAQPQVLCISEVRNFVLYITEGYYNVALHAWTDS